MKCASFHIPFVEPAVYCRYSLIELAIGSLVSTSAPRGIFDTDELQPSTYSHGVMDMQWQHSCWPNYFIAGMQVGGRGLVINSRAKG